MTLAPAAASFCTSSDCPFFAAHHEYNAIFSPTDPVRTRKQAQGCSATRELAREQKSQGDAHRLREVGCSDLPLLLCSGSDPRPPPAVAARRPRHAATAGQRGEQSTQTKQQISALNGHMIVPEIRPDRRAGMPSRSGPPKTAPIALLVGHSTPSPACAFVASSTVVVFIAYYASISGDREGGGHRNLA